MGGAGQFCARWRFPSKASDKMVMAIELAPASLRKSVGKDKENLQPVGFTFGASA